MKETEKHQTNYDDLAKELYDKINIKQFSNKTLDQISDEYKKEMLNIRKESIEKSFYFLCK